MANLIQKILTDYFRWTILVIVVLVVGLGYGLFINQQITTIQNVSFADRSRAQNDLQANQRYATALEDSLNKFKKAYTADDLQRLTKALPTESDFPSVLLMLNNLAETAGLKLDTITVNQIGGAIPTSGQTSGSSSDTSQTAQAAITGVAGQDIAVTFSGGTGYDQFKHFLGMFESSQRIFNVISLNFSQATSENEKTSPYSMILRTYYLPETYTPVE
jgi:hypothetical protein